MPISMTRKKDRHAPSRQQTSQNVAISNSRTHIRKFAWIHVLRAGKEVWTSKPEYPFIPCKPRDPPAEAPNFGFGSIPTGQILSAGSLATDWHSSLATFGAGNRASQMGEGKRATVSTKISDCTPRGATGQKCGQRRMTTIRPSDHTASWLRSIPALDAGGK
jgi:hypothetical protein